MHVHHMAQSTWNQGILRVGRNAFNIYTGCAGEVRQHLAPCWEVGEVLGVRERMGIEFLNSRYAGVNNPLKHTPYD